MRRAERISSLVYNSFFSKGLPLIRKEVEKFPCRISALFGQETPYIFSGDTLDHPDVKVIAPLHERELARADSAAPEPKRNTSVFRTISLEQMKRLISKGHNILFDARDARHTERVTSGSARNVPGLEAEEHF